MHLCSLADGQTKPCGIAEEFQPIMNLNNMSVEEIFNSDKMKELRKDMMTGKRNKVCEVCYKKEDEGESSVRQFYNSNDFSCLIFSSFDFYSNLDYSILFNIY